MTEDEIRAIDETLAVFEGVPKTDCCPWPPGYTEDENILKRAMMELKPRQWQMLEANLAARHIALRADPDHLSPVRWLLSMPTSNKAEVVALVVRENP